MRLDRLVLALALVLLVVSTPALAQVFDHPAFPAPAGVYPFVDPEMARVRVPRACTDGPAGLIVVGGADGLLGLGVAAFDDEAYRWSLPEDLAIERAVGDAPVDSSALAPTADGEGVYAAGGGVAADYRTTAVVRVEYTGEASMALTPAEVAAAAGGEANTELLATLPDGRLDAVLRRYSDGVTVLVRFDPEGEEGARAETLLTSDTLVERLRTDVGFQEVVVVGLAVDDRGRDFVLARAKDDVVGERSWFVLLRRDPDGTLVELTDREVWIEDLSVAPERYPALGIQAGIRWHPELDLILGVGNGVWLLSPDRPGVNTLVLPPGAILATTYTLLGSDRNRNHHKLMPDGLACLANASHGGLPTWVGYSEIFYGFVLRPDWLDLDRDGLPAGVEAQLGSDPTEPDTDGGGVLDGAELLALTDPVSTDDDRVFPQPVDARGQSARDIGAAAFAEGGVGWQWGAAAPDGSILFPGTGGLRRFTDWDEPAPPTGMAGCESPMAVGPDGALYAASCGVGGPDPTLTVFRPDGTREPLVPTATVVALVGADTLANDVAVRADGTVFASYRNGKLLRVDPTGSATIAYDAAADFLAAGGVDEGGYCLGSCRCGAWVGPVTWEPVRSITYFWVQVETHCGGQSSYAQQLVAMAPDGALRVVADSSAFAGSAPTMGSVEVRDTEPDMEGGLWVLAGAGLSVDVVRLDANFVVHDVPWSLAHAQDLIVTPDGRLFAIPMYYSGQFPPHWRLVEIVPVTETVEPGNFLMVSPGSGALRTIHPRGGSMELVRGAPLGRPVSVAGTDRLVAVGDAEQHGVHLFDVAADGHLGAHRFADGVTLPGGMDIDAAGNVVVVDRSALTLVRITPDGALTTLVPPGVFQAPSDVIAVHPDGYVVSDIEAGALVRVTVDGETSVLLGATRPGALALLDGKAFVVAAEPSDDFPALLGATTAAWQLGSSSREGILESLTASGGLAVDRDDNVVWLALTRGSREQPLPGAYLQAWRLTPDGRTSSLVSGGLGGGDGEPGDLCLVRRAGDPLPALPGAAPTTREAALALATAPPSVDGACSAGGTGDATWPALAPLVLLAAGLLRRRARRLLGLSAAALLLAACGGGGGGGGATSDASGDDLPGYDAGDVAASCQGKTLCEPGRDPICTDDGAGIRACQMDLDRCYVWTAAQTCLSGGPCTDGRCAPFCVPDCAGRECGDDGCGGNCGTCEAGDDCCAGVCGACPTGCDGKTCGDDGLGGSCGACDSREVCAADHCTGESVGTCLAYQECSAACPAGSATCLADCKRVPDAPSRRNVAELGGCTLLRCHACLDLTPRSVRADCLDLCAVRECAADYSYCFSAGSAGCPETVACLDACGEDGACAADCAAAAAAEPFRMAVNWLRCVAPECPLTLPPAERDACRAPLVDGACRDYYPGCFAP